jgi:hypothetical protein
MDARLMHRLRLTTRYGSATFANERIGNNEKGESGDLLPPLSNGITALAQAGLTRFRP